MRDVVNAWVVFFPIFTTYVLQEYTHKKGE